MLRFLRIRHLAIIDAAEIDFEPGLNVLTGETGAGKSILIEAVGLLLGGRASPDLVRTGEEMAIVEAIFENAGDEWLIRREVSSQGRSRAFVNGELVTAGALKQLSSQLIELHGQHEHQTLLDPSTHGPLLDLYGRLNLKPIADAFTAWREADERLTAARDAVRQREARLAFLTFQLGELEAAALRAGEDAELAAQRQVLMNAERIERLCEEAYGTLYEHDAAVLSRLAAVWKRVEELHTIDPVWSSHLDAKIAVKSQLEDLAIALRRYRDGLEVSPGRLQQVGERHALIERLKKKYGPTLDDAIRRRDQMRIELEEIEQGDATIERLERICQEARASFLARAEELSAARKRLATELSSALVASLEELAMSGTKFEVRLGEPRPESQWSATGFDQVEFFISPNPGEELRPLARIVSGGELARIMLALKTLTSTSRHAFSASNDRAPGQAAPGLIFDEVDAGIGGRVADVVGRKLRELGSQFQVLCVTHSPQIAAYADTHFQIEKSTSEGRTRTVVEKLDHSGREDEVSRMLGGEAVGQAIRQSAREMLSQRRSTRAKGESKSKGESESRQKRTR